MVKSCCVYGCSNRSSGGNKDLPFHRLPNDPKLLKLWLIAMRTESVRVNSNTRVCGAHFPGGRRSKAHNVPSIFPWTPKRTRKPPAKRAAPVVDEPKPALPAPSPVESLESLFRDLPAVYVQELEQEGEVSGEDTLLSLQPPVPVAESERGALTSALPTPAPAPTVPAELTVLNTSAMPAPAAEPVPSNEELTLLKEKLAAAEYRIEELEKMIEALHEKLQEPARLSLSTIKADDALVRFYTGLPSGQHFDALATFLSDCSKSMPLWSGNSRRGAERRTDASGCRTLSLDDELLLTLMKLQMNSPNQGLAIRFAISPTSVSRIFTTWLMLLYQKLKNSAALPSWPSKESIISTMPLSFTDLYPSTRVIIDCTEFPIQVSTHPDAQRVTWSSYKNRNTLKALVGITPGGAISFLSPLYGGSLSDREITSSSKIMELLDAGDSIMADKGFVIEDLCQEKGVRLNIPPFIRNDAQLTDAELIQTRRIASLHIHVERAMERIKNFHILDFFPVSHLDIADQLFFICAVLSDFDKRLVD